MNYHCADAYLQGNCFFRRKNRQPLLFKVAIVNAAVMIQKVHHHLKAVAFEAIEVDAQVLSNLAQSLQRGRLWWYVLNCPVWRFLKSIECLLSTEVGWPIEVAEQRRRNALLHLFELLDSVQDILVIQDGGDWQPGG